MGHYVQTAQVPASPERVFRAYTDPLMLADWMDMRAIRDQTGPLDRVGSECTLVVRGPWWFRSSVRQCDPPRSITFGGAGRLGASFQVTAMLTPRDAGTWLEQRTDYTLPFGALGRWLDQRFVEGRPRTVADREFARLLALVSEEDVRARAR
jgi:hypothetical protein